jgi:hypothetical protein
MMAIEYKKYLILGGVEGEGEGDTKFTPLIT